MNNQHYAVLISGGPYNGCLLDPKNPETSITYISAKCVMTCIQQAIDTIVARTCAMKEAGIVESYSIHKIISAPMLGEKL